jgi:hypothetical protein
MDPATIESPFQPRVDPRAVDYRKTFLRWHVAAELRRIDDLLALKDIRHRLLQAYIVSREAPSRRGWLVARGFFPSHGSRRFISSDEFLISTSENTTLDLLGFGDSFPGRSKQHGKSS